jgi:ATP-dependent helicase YprA (DUF1998 family)
MCRGRLESVHLGHDYLTDVIELRFDTEFRHTPTGISTLFALLEATRSVGIDRSEIDGTLHHHSSGEPPAFILFDSVPGGAGHTRRLGQEENLRALLKAAHQRAASCSCGEETSCYGCLRSYSNQRVHDQLARGSARDLLEKVVSA